MTIRQGQLTRALASCPVASWLWWAGHGKLTAASYLWQVVPFPDTPVLNRFKNETKWTPHYTVHLLTDMSRFQFLAIFARIDRCYCQANCQRNDKIADVYRTIADKGIFHEAGPGFIPIPVTKYGVAMKFWKTGDIKELQDNIDLQRASEFITVLWKLL